MKETVQIKGSALLGVLAWMRATLGVDTRKRLVAAVSRDWSTVFAGRIRAARWYCYGAYGELLATLERELVTPERPGCMREIGRFTGTRDVGGILRIVSAFASPEAVVVRGFGAWGQSYWSRFCDTGRVSLLTHGRHGATIGLYDFPEIAPEHCQLMEGWWEAVARAAGAAQPRVVQTQCVHRDDACCEFRGVWR